MNEKVLFVDDDVNILEAYQRRLQKVVKVSTALGGAEGLKWMAEKGPFAVVIADMQMPMMNGVEFLAKVKEQYPDTVRMMLTGHTDVQTAINAVNEGNIFRFMTKPCPPEIMGKALVDGIAQYRLVVAEKTLMVETVNGTIELLVEVLSWADPEAYGHALELRGRARGMARELKITDSWDIELAALLSWIGRVVLPHDLLEQAEKGNEVSEDLKSALERIPVLGHDLLSHIPRLEPVARIILYQNKSFDGQGGPEDGVAGEHLPWGSRILKVLKDLSEFEARGIPKREALALMAEHGGGYDPHVLNAAIALFSPDEKNRSIGTLTTTEQETSSLRVGDILMSNVKTLDDLLLIRRGEVVTEALLVRLRVYAKLVGIQEPVRVVERGAVNGECEKQE